MDATDFSNIKRTLDVLENKDTLKIVANGIKEVDLDIKKLEIHEQFFHNMHFS